MGGEGRGGDQEGGRDGEMIGQIGVRGRLSYYTTVS